MSQDAHLVAHGVAPFYELADEKRARMARVADRLADQALATGRLPALGGTLSVLILVTLAKRAAQPGPEMDAAVALYERVAARAAGQPHVRAS